MAAVLVRLVVQIEGSIQYPFLEDSHGDSSHVQIRLNLSKTDVPRRRPTGLNRVSNGIEGGLFMATRAFSNVQSAICNKIEKDLLVRACASNDVGMKEEKMI